METMSRSWRKRGDVETQPDAQVHGRRAQEADRRTILMKVKSLFHIHLPVTPDLCSLIISSQSLFAAINQDLNEPMTSLAYHLAAVSFYKWLSLPSVRSCSHLATLHLISAQSSVLDSAGGLSMLYGWRMLEFLVCEPQHAIGILSLLWGEEDMCWREQQTRSSVVSFSHVSPQDHRVLHRWSPSFRPQSFS